LKVKKIERMIRNFRGLKLRREKKMKQKENVINAKLEVFMPHTSLRDGGAAEIILIPPWKPSFDHQTAPYAPSE